MFEPPPKRHPFQSFQFWFLILVSFTALLGWNLDYFTTAPGDRLAGDPHASNTPGESLAWVAINREGDPGRHSASLVLPQQDESPTADMPDENLPRPRAIGDKPSPFPSLDRLADSAQASAPPSILSDSSLMTALPLESSTDGIVLAANEKVVVSSVEESAKLDQATPPPPEVLSASGRSGSPGDFAELDRLIEQGDDVAAHRHGSILYWQRPDQRAQLLDRLTRLATKIYFDPAEHYLPPRTVEFGDRLESLAKEYKVGWEYLAKLNRVDPQKIRPGQKLKVIEGPFGAVVDLRDHVLTVHAHGYFVAAFPCGIGTEGRTPTGAFQVRNKVVNPTYYGPDGVIAADDPNNPLGEHWLEINDESGSLSGIGIHGTIDPDSIGRSSSRGCVRLRNADVAAVFDLLTVGSEVVIRP